jgi:hypothetical protein
MGSAVAVSQVSKSRPGHPASVRPHPSDKNNYVARMGHPFLGENTQIGSRLRPLAFAHERLCFAGGCNAVDVEFA